jgi:hypothetical protein
MERIVAFEKSPPNHRISIRRQALLPFNEQQRARFFDSQDQIAHLLLRSTLRVAQRNSPPVIAHLKFLRVLASLRGAFASLHTPGALQEIKRIVCARLGVGRATQQ